MSESKHTPKPWHAYAETVLYGDRRGYSVRSEDNQVTIATGCTLEDASIIAAAPELLEALQEVLEDGLATNTTRWQAKAGRAIDKATGGES